jgi:hypothetical protein
MKVPRGQQPQRLPLPIFLANQLVRAPSPSRVCDERAMFSSFLCAGAQPGRAPLTAASGPLKTLRLSYHQENGGYCKAASSHQPLASSVRSLSHRARSR